MNKHFKNIYYGMMAILLTACTTTVPLEPRSYRGCGLGLDQDTQRQLRKLHTNLPNGQINEFFYATVYQVIYDSMLDLELTRKDRHMAADTMTENYLDCLKNPLR